MLKIKIANGEIMVEASGKTDEISAETVMAVRGVYRSLKEKSEKAAQKFKENMLDAMSDEVPFLTNEELDRVCARRQRELIEQLPKELQEIIEGIQKLAEKANVRLTPVVVGSDEMEKISKVLEDEYEDDDGGCECEDGCKENTSINLGCGTITAKIDDDGGNNQ